MPLTDNDPPSLPSMNTNTTFVTLDDNESFKTSGIPTVANIDA